MDGGGCLQTVDVLSDAALVQARSRLNPSAGVTLSALWVASAGQLVLIIHHLAVDGRRGGSCWRTQHRLGSASQRVAGCITRRWMVVCPVVVAAGRARCTPPEVVGPAGEWRAGGGGPMVVLPAIQPERGYLMPAPGICRRPLDAEIPGCF